jgi:hypothetical protein
VRGVVFRRAATWVIQRTQPLTRTERNTILGVWVPPGSLGAGPGGTPMGPVGGGAGDRPGRGGRAVRVAFAPYRVQSRPGWDADRRIEPEAVAVEEALVALGRWLQVGGQSGLCRCEPGGSAAVSCRGAGSVRLRSGGRAGPGRRTLCGQPVGPYRSSLVSRSGNDRRKRIRTSGSVLQSPYVVSAGRARLGRLAGQPADVDGDHMAAADIARGRCGEEHGRADQIAGRTRAVGRDAGPDLWRTRSAHRECSTC